MTEAEKAELVASVLREVAWLVRGTKPESRCVDTDENGQDVFEDDLSATLKVIAWKLERRADEMDPQ